VPRKGVGVQLSPWSLICRLGRCLTDSHKVGVPGSIPGPATSTAGGRGPAGVYFPGELGATPRPATASGRVRKLAKRPGREPVILWVRLPPRLLQRSRGPAAKTPGPHPGNDGSSPSGITEGLLVQRQDTGFARRESGFKSPAVHCGLMVQRNDASMACWKSGFNSR
jgi:hypothetical protein